MTEKEAYAIGYYFGRAFGNDELMKEEVGEEVWWGFGGQLKEGYDRGVADYIAIDMKEGY